MAPGIDLRSDGSLSDEGVVLRHAAVFVQSANLPEIGCQVLCLFAIFESFTDRQRESPVGEKRHSSTVVVVRILQWHGLEYHVQILECPAVEAGARHLRSIGGLR